MAALMAALRMREKVAYGRDPSTSTGTRISLLGRRREPPKKYEPTYKTQPDKRVFPEKCQRIISDCFEKKLHDVKYQAQACNKLGKDLATLIKNQVKMLGYKRFRIIVDVMLGPVDNTSVTVSSQCLWNPLTDTYAECSYRNDSIFAVGLVYAIYQE
ncbi:dynein light chain Tctex-type 5-A-like [Tubulanus polymorphus]|uniref:dynein light chain Tctex-type 5-A-like n=1 Tax=Tubulanus polymorphus TaxID=672921 RepID=UPI003DA32DFA